MSDNTVLDPKFNSGAVPPQYRGTNQAMPPRPGAPAMGPRPGAPVSNESPGWQKVAIGGATGILLGTAATLLTSSIIPGDSEQPLESGLPGDLDGDGKISLAESVVVGDDMKIAHNVNDSMSFGQAFAAARAEVGPGGCFEWHGGVYGTFTAEEWDSMSAAERAEYNDQFAWGNANQPIQDNSPRPTAHHNTPHHDTPETAEVNVNVNVNTNPVAQTEPQARMDTGMGDDNSVEVLSVYHDDVENMNVANVRVNDVDVVMIDVDNDQTFDLMGGDFDNNGWVESDETMEIEGQGITVASLGGYTEERGGMAEPSNEFALNEEGPDYVDMEMDDYSNPIDDIDYVG